MDQNKIVETICIVIEELKKADEKIIRDDLFGMLEKYCTVIYYPLENESNCGFMLTEDSDIEILRDIASRRMRLRQYKLEIYDGLDLVNQIAKRASSRFVYQEITKQQNIEAVVDNTYEELEHAENVSSESVNSDWMFRFLNS